MPGSLISEKGVKSAAVQNTLGDMSEAQPQGLTHSEHC